MVNRQMYCENDLVGIAKRENNNKRKYLVMNRLQGKHIAVNPKETLKMFDELTDKIKTEYKDEKVLFVGFAETATAIGSRLAVDMDSYYMQTTREDIKDVEYLYFSESHSHATEQKLIKTDLDRIIDEIGRIIFVEDEVTTGNTILKIIDIIEQTYEKKIAFSVASILNGMDEESGKVYEKRNIRLHYLVKTNHDSYTSIAEGYRGDGKYYGPFEDNGVIYKEYLADNYIDARRLTQGVKYERACDMLWNRISENIEFKPGETVLVLGTEEFMYPAIYVADRLEDAGCNAKSHSTTRSPIAVSSEDNYPVKVRYQLHSMYDDKRVIYVYDLNKYDKVLIVTDAGKEQTAGINSLCAALSACGNTDINVVRWCK